jgi:hypothetical protein
MRLYAPCIARKEALAKAGTAIPPGATHVPTAQLVLEDAEGGIEGLLLEIDVLNAGVPPKDAVEKYTEWESLLADKTSLLNALVDGPRNNPNTERLTTEPPTPLQTK